MLPFSTDLAFIRAKMLAFKSDGWIDQFFLIKQAFVFHASVGWFHSFAIFAEYNSFSTTEVIKLFFEVTIIWKTLSCVNASRHFLQCGSSKRTMINKIVYALSVIGYERNERKSHTHTGTYCFRCGRPKILRENNLEIIFPMLRENKHSVFSI